MNKNNQLIKLLTEEYWEIEKAILSLTERQRNLHSIKEKLLKYDTGGIVSEKDNHLTKLANKLFNVKPNKELLEKLKLELDDEFYSIMSKSLKNNDHKKDADNCNIDIITDKDK